MSNAAKYRKKAAEFEGLKQIDRAIAMYASAIQESEKSGEDVDVALLNKVGDLTLRQGRIADAVVYYERAVEHYATAGLFNNAIALCNKILRSAPGRSNVYYTLGRICARKGLRGDATRNFLEYASRMRQDGRVEEGMRALAEIADLMPELTEVRRLVEEHAERNGIALPARRTPTSVPAQGDDAPAGSRPVPPSLVFLDVDYDGEKSAGADAAPAPPEPRNSASLSDVMLFDPTSADDDVALDGFLSSADLGIREREVMEDDVEAARRQSLTDASLTWLVPPADEEAATAPEGLEPDELGDAGSTEGGTPVTPLDGLTSHGAEESVEGATLEGLEPTHDASGFEISEGTREPDAPIAADSADTTEKEPPPTVTPLEGVEPVPELEAAIAAGSQAAARGELLPLPTRPTFRLAPHEFVQVGELPPLRLADATVVGEAAAPSAASVTPAASPAPATGAPSPTLRSTPSVPISAVAAEANAVATTRRDSLRAAVATEPRDWRLRRRLAEALFEVGEREAALAELETALNGFADEGDIASGAEVADELVRVAGDRIPFHQRRVEMSVRLQDSTRLQIAYLDLADALVQGGDEGRARAVYARVLEMDPRDDRARSALGAAAPPPPEAATAERPDDRFVDLASWLEDDGEGSTRMRMREPVASGDEQADFDALLRHFREGVSRSLGEEDYESHYDLGVAYKEMGLLDDAIAEFQKALRSRSHRLPAYEALGQCFVEQERYQVAATVLSRALHEPGLTDEQRIGVLYLLALSSEALERWSEARSYYQRVYATDIHFRDVAARLAVIDQVAR